MLKPIRKTHPIMKILSSALTDLPAPINISIWWNYGSLLGLCLIIQTVTGLFLAMHYSSSIDTAFLSVVGIMREVNYGWLMRSAHANGASMFFLFMYIHMSRSIYYSSFVMKETWNIGVIIFIVTMATAFMGYVLPWGQMSFWGATVITNLFSAIPYIGKSLVEWIWGGFAVDNATLNRFFALHFILPFVLMALVMIHFLFLHQTGSNNPLGINSDSDRVPFHKYYSIKDFLGYAITLMAFLMILMFWPNMFTDPENYLMANPLITPIHIQPEWYFLWVYAILRSIPNKLGGVVAMALALCMLFVLPLTMSMNKLSSSFYPLSQIMFWSLISTWVALTWIGGRPVESPYIAIGQISTIMYFSYYMINPLLMKLWDKIST